MLTFQICLLTISSIFLYVLGFSLAVCNSILCLFQRPLLPAPCVLHFPFVRFVSTIFTCCILVNLLFLWPLHTQSCCWFSWIVFYLLVVSCNVAFCHVLLVGPPLEVIASFCNRLIVFRFRLVDSPLEVIDSFCDRLIIFHFQLSVGCGSPLELAEC